MHVSFLSRASHSPLYLYFIWCLVLFVQHFHIRNKYHWKCVFVPLPSTTDPSLSPSSSFRQTTPHLPEHIYERSTHTLPISIDRSKFTASISQPDRAAVHTNTTRSATVEGLYSSHSYRLAARDNPLCVHLHGWLWIYLYCRPQCRLVYGHVWRFTPVLTPGLAISIDWNGLSLILIPAWPKTIDQGAELSSGFNDLPAPPPAHVNLHRCSLLLSSLACSSKEKRVVRYYVAKQKWHEVLSMHPQTHKHTHTHTPSTAKPLQ